MAKEPAARFATPAEVAEALAPFAAGADLGGLLAKAEVETNQRDSPAGAKPLPVRGRRKSVAITLGLTALAAGLTFGIVVVVKDKAGKTLATIRARREASWRSAEMAESKSRSMVRRRRPAGKSAIPRRRKNRGTPSTARRSGCWSMEERSRYPSPGQNCLSRRLQTCRKSHSRSRSSTLRAASR